jgi:F0F1-type ATP synthase membrane subunit c/vacuolar-type H+-ATPase subunit K
MPLSKRKGVSKFVHRKLLFRLRRLVVIFLIILSILIYEISHNYIAAYLAIAGFGVGYIIGNLVSRRMHIISWDAATTKAVTKMDRIGIIILVAYIIFALTRHWIFSYWFTGYGLTAFSLSVGAGGMLGRLWNTRKKIREILKREGYLYPIKNDTKM